MRRSDLVRAPDSPRLIVHSATPALSHSSSTPSPRRRTLTVNDAGAWSRRDKRGSRACGFGGDGWGVLCVPLDLYVQICLASGSLSVRRVFGVYYVIFYVVVYVLHLCIVLGGVMDVRCAAQTMLEEKIVVRIHAHVIPMRVHFMREYEARFHGS